MAKIILVTGGTRSGKSDYAQQRAESMGGPRCFIATCVAHDSEMAVRIDRHRTARKGGDWHTIEEPFELERVFAEVSGYKTYLLDCLTLWVANLLEQSSQQDNSIEEDTIETLIREIVAEIRKKDSTVLIVTNEVGMGIVPENGVARKYRDLVGRCNRICAELSDEAFFVCAGIPVRLK